MLKLVKIVKDYAVADTAVRALNGVSLCFRKNEFVSILGPSGCGKTTLLNIVGGLDRATEGDLIIGGTSTKKYKDRDWDVYRNHRVGFIFQSYNLIPHQTVLGNVELALTIAGMAKEERVEKAKKALDKVGLSDQYYKKPNQLSGGQCQRVAIARALVNDPEILLADEPTGALDTKTSVEIMNLVKEIAKERLVIMVTHNPELAKVYSTRIIKMLDGVVLEDSMPFSFEDELEEVKEEQRIKEQVEEEERIKASQSGKKQKKPRAKMSFFTTFKLSLQNLISKRKRTILTSVASSIGIIGISLVLSLSYGVSGMFTKMQNDMLSGSPVTISEKAFDLASMISSQSNSEKAKIVYENGFVHINEMIKSLAERAKSLQNDMVENNISDTYLDYLYEMPQNYYANITLDYGLDVTNNIYLDFYENQTLQPRNISLSALKTIYTDILEKNENTEKYANLVMGLSDVFQQAINDEEYLLSQYELMEGKIATGKNEVMIVLDEKSRLSDLLLAQLGYYNQAEFLNMVFELAEDTENYDDTIPSKIKFSYAELLEKEFYWYPNNTVFQKTNNPSLENILPFEYFAESENFVTTEPEGEKLSVVGILRPKKGIVYGSLSSGFFYTEALTKHILEKNSESKIIEYMLERKADSFPIFYKNEQNIDSLTMLFIDIEYNYLGESRTASKGMGKANAYQEIFKMLGIEIGGVSNSISLRELGGGKCVIEYEIGSDGKKTDVEISRHVEKLPQSIMIYSDNLKQKSEMLSYLNNWNKNVPILIGGVSVLAKDRTEMKHTDTLSLIFGMITSLIDVVTVALIGFTSLSLLVSCVMIAIVTYISVVERTREIGVIRSLGGRKSDVSGLFTAETFILGLTAGLIAIIFTYIVSLILNLLLQGFIGTAIAVFPIHYAIIMVALSIVLTFISGVMPSLAAAKKDPVVALRTE